MLEGCVEDMNVPQRNYSRTDAVTVCIEIRAHSEVQQALITMGEHTKITPQRMCCAAEVREAEITHV